MRKTVFTCDHCGREIDAIGDYLEIQIDDFLDFTEVDLCRNCFHELNKIVLQYCNKEGKDD